MAHLVSRVQPGGIKTDPDPPPHPASDAEPDHDGLAHHARPVRSGLARRISQTQRSISQKCRALWRGRIPTDRRLAMQHQVVSRDEWLKFRLGLLKDEKELTHRSDELAQRRQELPWVRVDKAYRFET